MLFFVCSSCCGAVEPTYEAIWADKNDFNEVLISPTMINDHWPDNVLDALEKVRLCPDSTRFNLLQICCTTCCATIYVDLYNKFTAS